MDIRGSCRRALDAPAEAVYATLTDLERLPEWNAVITRVVERPDRLEPGTDWVVEMHAMGSTWNSRSRATRVDPATGEFAYISQTDDGNPSYAEWSWTVTPSADAARSEVVVSYALHPKTFWRRALLVRLRARALRRTELPASLAALEAAARARVPRPTD